MLTEAAPKLYGVSAKRHSKLCLTQDIVRFRLRYIGKRVGSFFAEGRASARLQDMRKHVPPFHHGWISMDVPSFTEL
jgi:hypothetical protein